MTDRPTIYIAGASKDIPRAQAAMHAAVQAGFRIKLDWTAAIAEEAAAGRSDRDLSIQEKIDYATADLAAAVGADVFWLLIPHESATSVGAWIEFGAALLSVRMHKGLHKEQLVICSSVPETTPKFSIFFPLAHACFPSDELALSWLARIATTHKVALDRSQQSARGYEWMPPELVAGRKL